MRVAMHPGQFTVLNSVNPAVVRASVRELVWHARFLDALGTDATAKIVIHVGGMVEGPEAAIERFVRVARALPEAVRRRLIVVGGRVHHPRDGFRHPGLVLDADGPGHAVLPRVQERRQQDGVVGFHVGVAAAVLLKIGDGLVRVVASSRW